MTALLIPRLIGLAIIGFGVYLLVNDILIRKKGKIIIGKVKEIRYNEKKVWHRIILEIISENMTKEISFLSTKKYEIGEIIKGVYYSNKRHEIISINQEWFFIPKGSAAVIIIVGLIFLLVSFINKNIPTDVLTFGSLIVTIIILLVAAYYNSKSLYKKLTEVEQVYYGNTRSNSTKSTANLIRYQSGLKSIKQVYKIPSSTIFITLIFLIFGISILTTTYITTKNDIDLSLYNSTMGKVVKIDHNPKTKTYILTYEYIINGKKYNAKYDTKKDFVLTYKGNKEKIYYNKKLPFISISNTEYISKFIVPLLSGLLFTFLGIHIQVENIQKRKTLKNCIVKEEQ